MSERLYGVTFEYVVEEGEAPGAVKSRLSSLGLLSSEQIDRILSGESVVLKSGLTHDQALRYQAGLEAAGAHGRLVPSPEKTSSSSLSAPAARGESSGRLARGRVSADDLTLAPAPKELETRMTCPKCGLEQLESAECAACGVMVGKFAKRQESEEEAPWERADSDRAGEQVYEGDMYQGQEDVSGQEVRLSQSSRKGLSGPQIREELKGIVASVGRMFLTAARLTAGFAYRESRRALAWITESIRSRAARRGADPKSEESKTAKKGKTSA